MITLNAFSPTPVELTPAEQSLYGQLDRVRQATNAGIRRWVLQWQDLLAGRVLDYGAGKPGTCRIPQPFREVMKAREYVPWEPDDPTPEGKFDAIICTQAAQNFEDPLCEFAKFAHWMKPTSSLIVTYPVTWEEIENEFWRFTRKGLWLCCHRAGLRIIEHETLVQVNIDGSLHLALVNGLVARRME